MSTISLRCCIAPSNAQSPVGVRILLDNCEIFSQAAVTESIDFVYNLEEDEAEHELAFEMFGKTAKHTVIDDAGNILQDAMLKISAISLDDIDIDQLVYDKSVYGHDFNGTQDPIEDKFYGNMGCNGTVRLQFSTPVYIWLLENL